MARESDSNSRNLRKPPPWNCEKSNPCNISAGCELLFIYWAYAVKMKFGAKPIQDDVPQQTAIVSIHSET